MKNRLENGQVYFREAALILNSLTVNDEPSGKATYLRFLERILLSVLLSALSALKPPATMKVQHKTIANVISSLNSILFSQYCNVTQKGYLLSYAAFSLLRGSLETGAVSIIMESVTSEMV